MVVVRLFLWLIILGLLASPVIAWYGLEDAPLVAESAEVNVRDVQWAKAFLKQYDPRNLPDGKITTITANQGQINTALAAALAQEADVLLRNCVRHADGVNADRCFEAMRGAGVAPDAASFEYLVKTKCAAFDARGVPTRDAHGYPVSKPTRKKLDQIFEVWERLFARWCTVLLEKVDAEGIAWERWIPKSMVVNNLGGGELEIKKPA